MNKAALATTALLLGFSAAPAIGQGVAVGDLKAKGATVLSADDVKTLVAGSNVRYQNENFLTQITFNQDGTLAGTSTRTGGAGTSGLRSFRGRWELSDKGLWCAETQNLTSGQGRGGGAKWCRTILKLDDKFYYAGGAAQRDEAQAYEMSIRR